MCNLAETAAYLPQMVVPPELPTLHESKHQGSLSHLHRLEEVTFRAIKGGHDDSAIL